MSRLFWTARALPIPIACALPIVFQGCHSPGDAASPDPATLEAKTPPTEQVPQGENLDARPAPGFPDDIQKVRDCGTTAESLLGEAQATLVRCPAGCTTQTVTGTGVYPTNTAACTSQVHAGVLRATGGLVLLTRTLGLQSYRGSEQFGIKSTSLGYFETAFYGQGVDDQGMTTTPVPTPPNE